MKTEETSQGRTEPKKLFRPRTRLAGALSKLASALSKGPDLEFERNVRQFMRLFHSYSPCNRMLIYAQHQEATFVKGKKQWEALGRKVNRGARAIHIVAPQLGSGDRRHTRCFSNVSVYDVSDTHGAPFVVPSLVPDTRNQESLVGHWLRQIEFWIHKSGITLLRRSPFVNLLVDGATNGEFIWVRPDLDSGTQLLVLAHEIGHVKLHFRPKDRGKLVMIDSGRERSAVDLLELEAELTAYLLLTFMGIDSSRCTALYLRSWEADMKKIRKHAERAFFAACRVLRECETRRVPLLVKRSPALEHKLSLRHNRGQRAGAAPQRFAAAWLAKPKRTLSQEVQGR